jgi:hypothetical protein
MMSSPGLVFDRCRTAVFSSRLQDEVTLYQAFRPSGPMVNFTISAAVWPRQTSNIIELKQRIT